MNYFEPRLFRFGDESLAWFYSNDVLEQRVTVFQKRSIPTSNLDDGLRVPIIGEQLQGLFLLQGLHCFRIGGRHHVVLVVIGSNVIGTLYVELLRLEGKVECFQLRVGVLTLG